MKERSKKTAVCLGLGLLANLAGSAMEDSSHACLLVDHFQQKIVIRSAAGECVWSHPVPAPYEAWMQADGSVVYTAGSSVEKIRPDLKAGQGGTFCWSYRFGTGYAENPLPAGNMYTCTPIHGDHVLITESGTFRLVELDADGHIVRCIKLPHPTSKSGHPLRMVRMTESGTFLVAYFYDGYFLEIDRVGTVLRKIDMGRYFDDPIFAAYEAVPLDNGRLLVSCGPKNQVLVLDKLGAVEWRLTADDLPPDMKFGWVATAAPLENGNLWVFNYCDGLAEVLAFEITPDKRVVNALRDPSLKGLTMGQRLNDQLRPVETNGLW